MLLLLLMPYRLLIRSSSVHHRPRRLCVLGRHPAIRRRSLDQCRCLRRSAVAHPAGRSHPARLVRSVHAGVWQALSHRARVVLCRLEQLGWRRWPWLTVGPGTWLIGSDAVVADCGRSDCAVVTAGSRCSVLYSMTRRCLSSVRHSISTFRSADFSATLSKLQSVN